MQATINPIPEAVLELCTFASKDNCRTNLATVRIEPVMRETDEGRTEYTREAIAIATDGHRLATVRFNLSDKDTILEPIHIPATLCVKILKATKKKDRGECRLIVAGETIEDSIVSLFNCEGDLVQADLAEIVFPEWKQVIPTHQSAGNSFGFDAGYLADFAGYVKRIVGRGNKPGVRLVKDAGEDGLCPTLFDVLAQFQGDKIAEIRYVLMPLRVN